MVRTLVLSMTLLAVATTSASAQITTYMAPQRPKAPTAEMVAAADSARADSIAQVSMTNMKAWVDSAAGVPVPEYVGRVDSAALVNDPGRPVTTFSDGSVAPNTASDLPAVALVGGLIFVAGLGLLARRPRPARRAVRSSPRN